jgi:hypothetical protein
MIKRMFLTCAIMFSLVSALSGEEKEKKEKWQKVSNDSFTVILSKKADIETLYGRIWARRLKENIRMEEPEEKTKKEKLELLMGRITKIFEYVKKIRELDPEYKGNERIVILRNKQQLRKMFMKLYNRDYKRGISFYSSRLNTIFTTEDVINAPILAHEMTHMVNNLEFKGHMTVDDDEDSAYRMEVFFRK